MLFDRWIDKETSIARYGRPNEKSYRNQFDQPSSLDDFYRELIRSECSYELIAMFDPTFIPKSVKHTTHMDWHRSTTSQKTRCGMEECQARSSLKN